MRSWLVAGWLALTVGSCTREAALTSRGGDLDADAGDAGFGAAFVSAGAGAKAGTVGSAPPSGSSAGGSAERLDNLGGSSTPGPSAGATSELPAAGALGGWMTEEEWAAASGVYEGKLRRMRTARLRLAERARSARTTRAAATMTA